MALTLLKSLCGFNLVCTQGNLLVSFKIALSARLSYFYCSIGFPEGLSSDDFNLNLKLKNLPLLTTWQFYMLTEKHTSWPPCLLFKGFCKTIIKLFEVRKPSCRTSEQAVKKIRKWCN